MSPVATRRQASQRYAVDLGVSGLFQCMAKDRETGVFLVCVENNQLKKSSNMTYHAVTICYKSVTIDS